MGATAPLAVATHRDCSLHVPTPGHPERPARLEAAIAGAALAGAKILPVGVDEASVLAAVRRVHQAALPERLREACSRGKGTFDSDDNPISAGTFPAALAAVAAVLEGTAAAATGTSARVWAPVRPPGHHAMHDRAMGFCFFNNVAIAAEALLAEGVGPLAIVDFDVHHGNGTQRHFWERDDVFYLSIHRYYDFYPGTGAGDEIGAGRGRGFTRNVPLVAGADDAIYGEALEAGLEDLTRAVRPEVWLVSAGFDAHVEDPLGGMAVTERGFAALGRLIAQAAGNSAVVAALEGGYSLEALRRSVQAFLEGLSEAVTP